MQEKDYILEVKNICKSFYGVEVLHNVDLGIRPGEAAAKFLDGQKLDELIPVDLEAVTKDNVDKYLKS